jgi:hypothetical protein
MTIIEIGIKNIDTEDMPGFGVGVAVPSLGSFNGDRFEASVRRFSQANQNTRDYSLVINGPLPIRAGREGSGYLAFGRVRALAAVETGSVIQTEVYGPLPGSWSLARGGGGFHKITQAQPLTASLGVYWFMFAGLPVAYVVRPNAAIPAGGSGLCTIQRRQGATWVPSDPARTVTAINHSATRAVAAGVLCQAKFEANTGALIIDVEECA